MKYLVTLTTAVLTVFLTTTAQAFCGFYVAKADTSLFNQASQVVLVRDGDRTVITMANPGTIAIWGAKLIMVCASLSIFPQLGNGGCVPRPT